MNAVLTPFDADFRPRLVVGVGFSLLAHLVLALAMTGQRMNTQLPDSVLAALPPPTPEDPVVRPGIEHSQAVTINWLGFETPTEHRAAPADSDQAALSPRELGNPEAIEAEVAETPVEVPAELPVPRAPVEVVAVSPEPASASPPETGVAEATPEVEMARPPLLALRTEAPALPSSSLLTIVKRSLEPLERAAVAATAAAAAQAATKAGEEKNAIPSEKEASPTSVEQALDWSPGRPLAGAGLDVTTVDPRWSTTTRLSALPRNPVVRIEFGRDGKVRKAEFIPGANTGYPNVDGPLMDALYRWTAKGKALADLPANNPEATASFRVRIVLVPTGGPVRRAGSGR